MPALGHHHVSWYNRELVLCARAGDEWRGSPTAIMSEGVKCVESARAGVCGSADRTAYGHHDGRPGQTVLACASLYYHPPVTLTHLFVCLSVPEILHAHPAGLRPHQLHTTRWVSQPTFSYLSFAQYLKLWFGYVKNFDQILLTSLYVQLYDSCLFPIRFLISKFMAKVLNKFHPY